MNIQIRQIKASDNLLLAKMIRTTFEEHNAPKTGTVYSDPTTDNLYELFSKEKSILWVAELNSIPIGCCGIFPTEGLPSGCAELVKFYISSEARGKGIGRELMKKSLQSAKEFGYKEIYLESLPQFSTAVGMYEKLGFKNLPKPLGASGHSGCDIWMIRAV